MKHGLKYCPKCKALVEVVYYYPDKSVMLKCDHIVSKKEQIQSGKGFKLKYLILFFFLVSCSSLKKDNEPKNPVELSTKVEEKVKVYLEGVKLNLDPDGFVLMGSQKGIGDSALFSCLARVSGATDFNPEDLLTPDGKPVRHPLIWKDREKWLSDHCTVPPKEGKSSCTPVSKDMVNGILWCIHDLATTEPERAQKMGLRMMDYGRANKTVSQLWNFCSDDDVKDMNINQEDLLGRCVMTPQVSKDLYRVLISTGWECDESCKVTMITGTNAPLPRTGYSRHLGVITTVRNGLVEGALNENSLSYLKDAATGEPRNALYQAAYAMFKDGDQSKAYTALLDESLFPSDAIPTNANYCTDYLFQRDEKREEQFKANAEGCISYRSVDNSSKHKTECELEAGKEYKRWTYNDDWLPCGGSDLGRGVDWLFAAHVALGKVIAK